MVKYKRRIRGRRENRAIALERIRILFHRAQDVCNLEPELSQHYVELARKLSMRYKVTMPIELRRMICRQCKRFILPGKTCRIRIRQKREPHVVITCLICGEHMRVPLRKKMEKTL